jgi:hypothetical protein
MPSGAAGTRVTDPRQDRLVAGNGGELRRRLRLLWRRLNLFDPSRTGESERGNVSGPPPPTDGGAHRG